MMRAAGKILLVVLLAPAALPAALAAQSVVTIAPEQCVWRAGDNPTWAAPNLDDSTWQPFTGTNLPDSAYLWIRCRLPLEGLRPYAHPALLVNGYAAYQEYVQGNLATEFGNLRSGDFSVDAVRVQPLPLPLPAASTAVVAFRITERPQGETGTGTFALSAGDAEVLQGVRAQFIVDQVKLILPYVLLYSVVGVVGVVQLGLFYYDRTRRDLLWLSLYCIVIAILRVNTLTYFAYLNYPDRLYHALYLLGNFGFVAELIFFFALARKRIPWIIWVFYFLSQAMDIQQLVQLFLSPVPAQRLNAFFPALNTIGLSSWTVLTLAPFLAFWPWRRIPANLLSLAVCCCVWGFCDFVYFLVQTFLMCVVHRPDLFFQNARVFYEVRAFVSGITVLLILALLFRDQRRITEERAVLAGEMASAREIQQYLIPEKLPPTPGLAIHSVYHPAREVGGDFFQVLPDPRDSSTLIVVGDVAGKGLKAGMLAALIVGSIRTAFQFTADPGRILALLNERLQGRGLVTCLAMRIDPSGRAEIANAGHLPPYVNGRELALEGALPLGALPAVSFPTMKLQLSEGESLLFVSDGVVEARNARGELFGFDRAAALSREPADSIAQAAQHHGQEDDITVLTLALAPVGAMHA